MSTSIIRSHDNVRKLHVPHITSKFPLSSPISDDQISNRSFESKRTATSSDLASSPQSSQNPFGDSESGNTSGQDEFHLERYSESSTQTKVRCAKRRSKESSRELQKERDASVERRKKPGLNVITDFSKSTKHGPSENPIINHVPVRQPKLGKENDIPTAESQTGVRKVGLEKRFANPGFVNLSDLEGLRKNKKGMTQPKGRKGFEKSKPVAVQASQTAQREREKNNLRIGLKASDPPLRQPFRNTSDKPSKISRDHVPYYLQAPEREMSEVSPTARSVVIGISVPEDEVEAHRPSDEASSALTLQTPSTPTIIVTPADATVGWSHCNNQSSERRPASSIYSQVPGVVYRQDADAPPVPSLPDMHKYFPVHEPEQVRQSIDTWEASPSQANRPFPPEAIIDEDDAHQMDTMPLSAGSKDEILPSSCDTGRPRSKGWWNLMLSPMLSRAGTNATKKTTSPLGVTPALPYLSATTTKGLILGEQTSLSAFSPETPRRAGLENGRNSTWSNWTQWEQDRDQMHSSRESSNDADNKDSKIAQHNESAQVVVNASAKKLGLAAEYYQACAFDLLNSVPYFECFNHDCANALPKLGACPKEVIMPVDTSNAMESGARVMLDKDVKEPPSPGAETRLRSDSDSTVIEDDPIELSPNVRKAHARPILKAAQPQKIDSLPKHDLDEKGRSQQDAPTPEAGGASASRSITPPPYSPPPTKPNIPRYVGIMPPSRQFVPSSPAPLSPQAQTAINPHGGIPMSQIHQPAPTFITLNSTYPTDLPPRPGAACLSLSDIRNPEELGRKAETRRQRLEQEDAVTRNAGGLWRGRGCFPEHGCFGQPGSAGRTRRRWYIVIATSFVLMIILAVVLATQLTRRGDQTPVQSQWLNLTGYPPMPTGISTIAQPDIASAVTGCVQPGSLWSCALPREDQEGNSPNDSDQPNFRLEIRFRNGTVDANSTIPILNANNKRATGARGMAMLRRQNDPFTNSLFEPIPAPPGLAEQKFLGNTTDNTTSPFGGETTPFFITLLPSDRSVPASYNDTNQPWRRRVRRQNRSGSGSIPAPAILPDGTAAAANLLPNSPLPHSQPVMLYDRGLVTEHYGFYTYYDKSIFIKSTAQFNTSSSSPDSRGDDDTHNSNGGSPKQDADLRCTWAQTRFLVQMWTNGKFGGQLLPSANGTATVSGPANDGQALRSGKSSSAMDFTRPGSLPYPITMTVDRHGGDASKKGVYCYGMDGQQKMVVSEKKFVAEQRGAGGSLINAAPGIFSNAVGDKGFDPDAGGIDGGTGGCGCEWRNWVGNGGK